AAHGGRRGRGGRRELARGPRRRHPHRRQGHEDRGRQGQEAAEVRRRRRSRLRRRDHGHRYQDEPRLAQGRRRADRPRRRRRRPSPLQRPQRLRGGRRGGGPRPRLRPAGGPRDRADGAGARARRRRQHGGQGRRLQGLAHRQHRRGLPPRRRLVRRVGRREGGGRQRPQARPRGLSQAALQRRPPHGRHHHRPLGRRVDDERRGHAQGAGADGRVAGPVQGPSESASVRREDRVHRVRHDGRAPPRNRAGPPVEGARRNPGGRMSPVTLSAPKQVGKPQPALPGGYAGQILRVDLSKRKAWGEPWTPEQMRDLIGGAGLGAMILYRETRKGKGNVSWETPNALSRDLGMTGHQLSVYSIGPAGEHLVRWAAIQGDYGHVASKNGVGAVMGKKKLKAVAIVKGTKALRAADPRGVVQAADDIAHDLKTDPSARSLYEYGTLPGVVNLSKMGALPIRNYTTSLTGDVD